MIERDTSFLDTAQRGVYFAKKAYDGKPLPPPEQVLPLLPSPIVPHRPDWAECYRYAVQVLLKNRHSPGAGTGFVSNFVDAAFNRDIFLWDTCFMSLFCNLLHPYVPGICSLDNFYCKQFDDGEIPREMVRDTGKDFLLWVNAYDKPLYSYFHNHYGFRGLLSAGPIQWEEMYSPDLGRTPDRHPYLTLDNLNHPIAAMAEWQSYLHTGDTERLRTVFEPLYHYYEAFREHLRHASGLYVTDWASMDNSPRNRFLGLAVDTSCEMALFAQNLLDMSVILMHHGSTVPEAERRRTFLRETKEETVQAVRRHMWDEKTGFFYDLTFDLKPSGIKTAAAFWALISGAADDRMARRLCAWLEDPTSFRRTHRVPVLAADEEGYHPEGGYWAGSVWAPIDAMIVLGLKKRGFDALARKIALNHLDCLTKVFLDTGTIWENYPADSVTSGDSDHRDMVGWSGVAPIWFLLEYGVGLSADVREDAVTWRLDGILEEGCDTLGCERYWFLNRQADFLARKKDGRIQISVRTPDAFLLKIRLKDRVWPVNVNGGAELQVPVC